MGRFHKWLEPLDSTRGRRMQVYFYLCLLYIYGPTRKVFLERYRLQNESGSFYATQRQRDSQTAMQSQLLLSLTDATNSERPATARVSTKEYNFNLVKDWLDFPRFIKIFKWLHRLEMIWMIYVLFKYLAPGLINSVVESLQLRHPAHCYTLGRFLFMEHVSEMIAVLFVTYHLTWRLVQELAYNPIFLGVLYLLAIDDRDIANYYWMLDGKQHHSMSKSVRRLSSLRRNSTGQVKILIEDLPENDNNSQQVLAAAIEQPSRFKSGLQMMHDVMSFRIIYRTGARYKLRPNRTRAAYTKLRDYMRRTTIFCSLSFISLTILITSILVISFVTDKRYLRAYAGCDSQLDQLAREGKLTESSFHFTPHEMLYLTFEVWENFILWAESGCTMTFGASLAFLLEYDLLIHWKHVNGRVEMLLELSRDMCSTNGTPQGSSRVECNVKEQRQIDHLIFELQMEFQDLIKQIEHVEDYLTDAISILLFVWFSLLAFYTYTTSVDRGQLPLALHLTMLYILFMTTVICILILTLHRRCLTTYPKICSLMAHDSSKHKRNFIGIMDYYLQKRTCFKIYRCWPLTASTYMTLIGYSFSCFFILAALNRR